MKQIIVLVLAYLNLRPTHAQDKVHVISLQTVYGFQMPTSVSVGGADLSTEATFRMNIAGFGAKIDRRWNHNILLAQGNFFWTQHSVDNIIRYADGRVISSSAEFPFSWNYRTVGPINKITSQAFLGYGKILIKPKWQLQATLKGGITAQNNSEFTFHHFTPITVDGTTKYAYMSITYGVILMPTVGLSSTFELKLSERNFMSFEVESSRSLGDFFFSGIEISNEEIPNISIKESPLWLVIGKIGFSYKL